MDNLAQKLQDIECSCIKPHGFKKRLYSPDASEADFARIMPQGVRGLYLSDNTALKKKLSRFYRLDTPESLELSAADFLGRGGEAVCLPEDIRLVVSDGAYRDAGKQAAERLGAAHLLCGGGNLSNFDYISDGGLYRLNRFTAVDAIIDDPEEIDLPQGFAFVLNLSLSLFDWDISSLLFGGSMCGHMFKEAQRVIRKLTDAVRIFPKKSRQLKREVFDACVAAASLIETVGPPLITSGALQAAAALSMLFLREDRTEADFYGISFLLAPVVAKTYEAFLEGEIPFAFPPDNNLRAAKISEYLGVPEGEAHALLPPYLSIKTVELTDYRINVYRDELLRHIHGVVRTLDEAYPVYFKLCDDDGFSLKGLISSLDSSLALALGSDVLSGDTLLGYIRGKGLLDRYII
jgi:hypothetical protein